MQRAKNLVHRLCDPPLVWPNAIRSRHQLRHLADGEYRSPVDVPYVPQFASPDYIRSYIHKGFHGRDDPAWRSFGAPDPDQYDFWARRVCALACLKMAAKAFDEAQQPTLWELVQRGLAYGGYRAHDERGKLVDEGWFYHAIVKLAAEHGLRAIGRGYVSIYEICRLVLDGWLVALSVSPELGEHGPVRRYGGHMILVYGFIWQNGHPKGLMVHNPSGRYTELQANALIPADRFQQAFAQRLIAFRAK